MPKSFQQKLKILYLMQVFMERTDEQHPMSVKDLLAYLEEFGIHAERKTIYDDIENLRVFGMDIVNRREKPAGFYLASREFETAELKLLIDAVQSSHFLTTGKSRQLIHKLEGLTSVYQARELQRQMIVQDRVKNKNENIYYNVDEIHKAISQNRQISFQYAQWTVSKELHLKKGGARYHLSPWQLIWKDENYYLIGIDESCGVVKHYRVDKMHRITAEDLPRSGTEIFENFDGAQFVSGTFGMFGGRRETICLEFENALAGVLIDRFGPDIMIMSRKEECSITRVQVNVSDQFFGWLSALGKRVKIVSPENVRREYRDFLKRALENYEG